MPINYKNYHPKWKLIVRLIKKRAGNRCEGSERWPLCRAENGQPHPVTTSRVVLTVHHIDYIIRNNRFHNLRALCQRCHLSYHRKKKTTA